MSYFHFFSFFAAPIVQVVLVLLKKKDEVKSVHEFIDVWRQKFTINENYMTLRVEKNEDKDRKLKKTYMHDLLYF